MRTDDMIRVLKQYPRSKLVWEQILTDGVPQHVRANQGLNINGGPRLVVDTMFGSFLYLNDRNAYEVLLKLCRENIETKVYRAQDYEVDRYINWGKVQRGFLEWLGLSSGPKVRIGRMVAI